MLEQAKQLIEQYALHKKVAVAVSGGEDSMALLHLFLSYAKEKKLSLSVIHVDHGIRENSAKDSAFVKEYCAQHGVEFHGVRVDVPALCKRSGRGVECEAHFARKAVFDTLLRDGRADLVATAHHARDNAETVLLHLFRGCGLQGLSGMRTLTEDGLFRPFLTTQKEDICAYAAENALPFVTDQTNADTQYDRNYIRHAVLPAIRARFPAAEKAICRTATFAAQADEEISAHLNARAFAKNDGAVSLQEDYLSAPYIFAALERLGQRTDVYTAAIDSVQKLKECKPCARVDLGNGVVAAREYGCVTFYRVAAMQEGQQETPFVLPADAPLTVAAGCGVTVSWQRETPVFPAPKGVLYLDADKLPAQCVWRVRKEGDRFVPYGGGRKKLKEYLIDKKVPKRLRDALPLLCFENEVLAIAGYEISDGVKVEKESKNILCVRICTGVKQCDE